MALFFQCFLMQNGSKNAPKMHWLSFQAHPKATNIEKWGPKRPQEKPKINQGEPKWSKRAPKATPSDPKSRQNPTFCSTRLQWGLLWFGSVSAPFCSHFSLFWDQICLICSCFSSNFCHISCYNLKNLGGVRGGGWGWEKAHFPNAPPFASNSCKTKSNDWHGAALLCDLDRYIY